MVIARAWWSLIRFGFRLLYNEMAWTYDFVSWAVSLGKWRAWQRAALDQIADPDGRLLELAHGTANLQIDMANRGYQPVAIDLSRSMGKIARAKLIRNHHMPRLVRATAMQLPFPNEAFLTIVSTFPTEFIFRPETIAEICRALAPTGRLIVVLNGMLAVTNPIVWLLEELYQITGQRGPLPETLTQFFDHTGLSPQLYIVKLDRSVAWVLVATKT